MDGYIRLYRKILENPVFQNANLLKVLIWCLLKATYKEREQMIGLQIVRLEPGQFVYGRNKASQELKIKPSTLNDYMQALKMLKIINIKTNNKFSVISLENWELYQSENDKTNIKNDSKATTDRQQSNTNNKDNKVNKDKKKEIKIFVENSIEFQLCLNLKALLLKNNPGAKIPDNLQGWAVEFDRMIRLDHRSAEDIQTVMEFSQSDSFWKANILSPRKLREKYDTLWLQKNNRGKAIQQKSVAEQNLDTMTKWLKEKGEIP